MTKYIIVYITTVISQVFFQAFLCWHLMSVITYSYAYVFWSHDLSLK